jgi:cell division protein FtsL
MARSVRKFTETVELRSLLLKRLKSHRHFPAVVITAVILTCACIHIWQRVVVMSLVTEVTALEKENMALIDDTHKVQTDLAALTMASRIERYAMDTLGLQRIRPDRLYTLVPETPGELAADRFATMISSIRRVADFIPVVTEAQGAAQELQPITFGTDSDDEADR